MHVLVVNPPPQRILPEGARESLADIGWDITTTSDYRTAEERARAGAVDAVVIPEPPVGAMTPAIRGEFDDFVRHIDALQIAALLLTDEPVQARSRWGSVVEVVGRDISLAELRGRLAMVERYQGRLRRMERELRAMELISKQLDKHFREVDEEMRLAGRLQRDFLPTMDEPIQNVRFASLYRPAGWVSGDMFDVLRIDEDHTGVYVADAIGHGMAAGLLTMFIKRAISPKLVSGESYEVLSPSQVMATLNTALTEQSLPNCQFVTACYAVLNHRTMVLSYARGGHPYPVLMRADGSVTELKTSGGLLGLFEGEEFPVLEAQLERGDKILFYTDGLELALQTGDCSSTRSHKSVFESIASLPIADAVGQIESLFDNGAGPFKPQDDVTVVGFEVMS